MKTASPSTIAALLKDVSDGLRVWRTRDKIPITDAQILERARNIVNGLVGNYFITPVPEPAAVDWSDPRISGWEPGRMRRAFASREELQAMYADGKPAGHLATCRCDKCDTFNRSARKDPS